MNNLILLWCIILSFCHVIKTSDSYQHVRSRSFVIDPIRKTFLLDGEPFRYVSGSMHYFRVHPELWNDRLLKIRAAGFNAIQFYVEWSSHEPKEGGFYFEGLCDVERFLRLAQQNDLHVILRPGPFIDAERDMGGLPPWLLKKNPHMKLRTSDPSFLQSVDNWYRVLFAHLKKFTYKNGGPIIMVQVENEYGSYALQTGACDTEYLAFLRDITKKYLGQEVFLFSTDGDSNDYVRFGKVAGVYSTVDFGTRGDVNKSFAHQRLFEPDGPLVNSEFYPGWLDHWGQQHAVVNTTQVAETLDSMLALGASVNVYMVHGGTSFGFQAGSNDQPFQPNPTSYDYDAPITEAGDLTEKYFAIKEVIQKYLPMPKIDVNASVSKAEYGKIWLKPVGTMLANLNFLSDEMVSSKEPLTFEELGQNYGFVLYETTIQQLTVDPSQLNVTGIHDRGYVFVDNEFRGILSRINSITTMPISIKKGQKLQIIVENQGRLCYGENISDFKGITTNVTLGSRHLFNWNMHKIPLNNVDQLFKLQMNATTEIKVRSDSRGEMTFWKGVLRIPCGEPAHDTFIRTDAWTKGVLFVNGFNLGRYWPRMGPQETLYLPAPLLKGNCKPNKIVLLEQDEASCWRKASEECYITSVKEAKIDGPVPFPAITENRPHESDTRYHSRRH